MESPEYRTCREVINHLLLDPNRGNDTSGVHGFMVHESIFDEFCENLARHQIPVDEELIWEYTLYVSDELFLMKLIHITVTDTDQQEYLNTLVEHAKVSFYWKSTITLYATTEHFHYLQNFIVERNLKNSIKRTYTTQSISYERTELKVIEFDEHITSDIVQEFYETHKSLPASMYYVTHALDYLAPKNLERFDKPYTNQDTLLILYLVLDYHRSCQLRNIREVFNIVDLCAMKLAFDDPRYEYENCEFDKLIKSLLNTKQYIKSRVFDMKLYVINKGIYNLPDPWTITYFMANYQTHFDRIEYFEQFRGWGKRQNFIKLAEIVDPLNLIAFLEHNPISDIFFIDGTNFTQWSGELFLKLCKHGARRIIIDTTAVGWEDCGEEYAKPCGENCTGDCGGQCDEVKSSLEFFNGDYVKYLEIVGTNDCNFIENFLNWMKRNLADHTKYFNISFNGCQINHPFIFNRLVIGNIELKNLMITTHLLASITRCEYNDITTFCCKLENNVTVIGGLDAIERNDHITLEEEGHTLELFLQYAAEQMMRHDLREFEFHNKIFIITNAFLNFDEYKFVFNQDRTRIDFYHKSTNRVIDIYAYRFRNRIGSEEDYDFYD